MPVCGRCGPNGCFQCQKPVGFSFERYGWEMEFLWWEGYEDGDNYFKPPKQ
jgi:hypothetical protein